MAIELPGKAVDLGPEFYAGHVSDANDRARVAGAQDDLCEFLRVGQTSAGFHGVLELLIGRRRGRADLTGRDDRVLVVDRGDEIGGGHAQSGEPVRFEPDPHAVAEVGHDVDAADTGHPREGILEVDRGEVREKHLVISAVRSEQRHQHEHVRAGFLGPHAGLLHFLRQLAHGLADPVLHVDRRLIRVRSDRERDVEAVRAVVRRGRAHIEHVFDAVHLPLDRGRHGFFQRLRAGPDELGADPHDRRRDFRELFDRQRQIGNRADYGHDQRDDEREFGAIDEECGEHAPQPSSLVARTALTGTPGLTRWRPSTITLSPS